MLITPSFKKSLIVEQLQGNHLKEKGKYLIDHPISDPKPCFLTSISYHYTTRLSC